MNNRLLPTGFFLINPMLFFSIGFIYYLLTPVFSLAVLVADTPFDLADIPFDLLFQANKYISLSFFDMYYFLDVFIILVTFYLGYRFSFFINYKLTYSRFDLVAMSKNSAMTLAVVFVVMSLGLVMYSISLGVVFFSGYRHFNVTILGSLSTLAYISLFCSIFFYEPMYKYIFLSIFIGIAVLLLGLGSRNIVLNGFISLAVYKVWLSPQILKSYKLYFVLLLLMLSMIAIGIWRSGYEFSLNMMISHFFADALFVMTSASSYLQNIGVRPVLEFPSSLFAGVVNFLPSLLFPQKIQIIAEMVNDHNMFSPFGASSIIVNLYSNFGMLYPIYIFFMAILYTYLYQRACISTFYRSIYIVILPLLMFQFFNQPLYSLVKLLFYNGIIIPFTIMVFFSFFINAHKRLR